MGLDHLSGHKQKKGAGNKRHLGSDGHAGMGKCGMASAKQSIRAARGRGLFSSRAFLVPFSSHLRCKSRPLSRIEEARWRRLWGVAGYPRVAVASAGRSAARGLASAVPTDQLRGLAAGPLNGIIAVS